MFHFDILFLILVSIGPIYQNGGKNHHNWLIGPNYKKDKGPKWNKIKLEDQTETKKNKVWGPNY